MKTSRRKVPKNAYDDPNAKRSENCPQPSALHINGSANLRAALKLPFTAKLTTQYNPLPGVQHPMSGRNHEAIARTFDERRHAAARRFVQVCFA